jgi:hypothetical protein
MEDDMKRLLVPSFAAFVSMALSSAVYGADMYVGTWKIDIAKSTYSPGPAPKGPATTKIEAVENGVKLTADTVNAQGQKTHVEFTVKFDGKDYPFTSLVDGKPAPNAADMISAKRIDDYTFEATTKLKGKPLLTARTVASKDGKTETTTFTGVNAQGQKVNNVVLGEK